MPPTIFCVHSLLPAFSKSFIGIDGPSRKSCLSLANFDKDHMLRNGSKLTNVKYFGASSVLNAFKSSYLSVLLQPPILDPSTKCSCRYQSSKSCSLAGSISVDRRKSGWSVACQIPIAGYLATASYLASALLARTFERSYKTWCQRSHNRTCPETLVYPHGDEAPLSRESAIAFLLDTRRTIHFTLSYRPSTSST